MSPLCRVRDICLIYMGWWAMYDSYSTLRLIRVSIDNLTENWMVRHSCPSCAKRNPMSASGTLRRLLLSSIIFLFTVALFSFWNDRPWGRFLGWYMSNMGAVSLDVSYLELQTY
jgi:hypothetical protein